MAVVLVNALVLGMTPALQIQLVSANPADCTSGELTSERTRDSKVFLNEDCSHTAMFATYLNYERAPGQWEDVDLRFHPDGTGFVADRHDVIVGVHGAQVESN